MPKTINFKTLITSLEPIEITGLPVWCKSKIWSSEDASQGIMMRENW